MSSLCCPSASSSPRILGSAKRTKALLSVTCMQSQRIRTVLLARISERGFKLALVLLHQFSLLAVCRWRSSAIVPFTWVRFWGLCVLLSRFISLSKQLQTWIFTVDYRLWNIIINPGLHLKSFFFLLFFFLSFSPYCSVFFFLFHERFAISKLSQLYFDKVTSSLAPPRSDFPLSRSPLSFR